MNVSLKLIVEILPGKVLETAHLLVVVFEHPCHDYPRITHFLILTVLVSMGILLLRCCCLLNYVF